MAAHTCRAVKNAAAGEAADGPDGLDGHVRTNVHFVIRCHLDVAEVFRLPCTELLTKDEDIERLKHVMEGLVGSLAAPTLHQPPLWR